MARRAAVIRFSNVLWAGTTPFSAERGLRPPWIQILQDQASPHASNASLIQELLERVHNPEFRHQPPLKADLPRRLQGGDSSSVFLAAQTDEPNRTPLLVASARSRPFRIRGASDFEASGSIRTQLFGSGYLVVDVTFRIRADPATIGGERLWQIAQSLSPNETHSQLVLAKNGLSGSPREFALGVLDGLSHSLMLPPGSLSQVKDRWQVAIMAENGPMSVPREIAGHKLGSMTGFGEGSLQAGERGYYYSENPRQPHRNLRRRLETLRTIFDFTRYQRDCILWANECVAQFERRLASANLIGGAERKAVDLVETTTQVKRVADIVQSLDDVVSATKSESTRWQRRIHTLFSDALDLPRNHTKYEKHAAGLVVEIAKLRSRTWIATQDTVPSPVDVFISYAHDDAQYAIPLKRNLEDLGIKVFFDTAGGLSAGDPFGERIADAILGCKAVLAVWTPRTLARPWCRRECYMARELGKLVPVACAPLLPIHLRDFMEHSYENLAEFDGDGPHLGWSRTLTAIAAKLDDWVQNNPRDDGSSITSNLADQVRNAARWAHPRP